MISEQELVVKNLNYRGHTIRALITADAWYLVVPDVEAAIPTTNLWAKAQKKLRERERLLEKKFTMSIYVEGEQLQLIEFAILAYVLGWAKKEQSFDDWRRTEGLHGLLGVRPVMVVLEPEQLEKIEGPEDQEFADRRKWIEYRFEINVLNTLHPFHHQTATTGVVVDYDETLEEMLKTLPEGEREGLTEKWRKRISPYARKGVPPDPDFYVRCFESM